MLPPPTRPTAELVILSRKTFSIIANKTGFLGPVNMCNVPNNTWTAVGGLGMIPWSSS